jgi:hypothetical protein
VAVRNPKRDTMKSSNGRHQAIEAVKMTVNNVISGMIAKQSVEAPHKRDRSRERSTDKEADARHK